MKNKIIIILLITFQIAFAQKKDENIGTEVVNVVKPYTPSISDAFKVKEIPTLDDTETSKKEDIKYQIFSFPVASTFAPSKGKAAGVDKVKEEKLFQNYVTLGFGNYTTANAELFLSHQIDNYQYAGAKIIHLSSQGGIKGIKIDDKFSESSADLMYGYNRNDFNFKLNLGYKNESYNWYGLPLENSSFSILNFDDINPKHQYNTIKLGSEFLLSDSFFNKATVNFISFSDNYGSKENRFIIQPNLTFDFGDTSVKTKFGIDYLNTSFKTSYLTVLPLNTDPTNIEKSNLIFNINPSFQIVKDDLSVELGADVVFLSRVKEVFAGIKAAESNNDFFIYPKVKGSYKLVNDLMIAFAGADGKLIQNSYADFTSINKFLSPTVLIEPTDQQFDIYAGLRGKLASSLSYNIKASYISSRNKALFKSNPNLLVPTQNYTFGNSFDVVYDNIKNIGFYGELKSDISKNISLGLNMQLNNYKADIQKEVWNLPSLEASFSIDFNVGKKWYAGTQLFYVGERKDEFTNLGFTINLDTVKTLEAYFDINAHVGYKHNERLAVFLKGNNLANQNYNRWLNYPVQGAQVVLGASYKFDF